MKTFFEKIGIIAGGGQFPALFAETVRKKGLKTIIIAHKGESSGDLSRVADSLHWVRLGQLGKIITHFKKEGVTNAVMLGSITKTSIFKDIRPDLKGLTLWNKIDARQDDAILRAVADALEKDGISVVDSTQFIEELLFPKGIISNNKLNSDQIDDITFGWKIARAIGKLDIGQCVVVRNRTVLAVEAIEGTDATIKRGGSLGHEKTVVVKVKKPNQDTRFDLPAIGKKTIKSMVAVNAGVLAVEAGQALLFDRRGVIKAANNAGIIVVGLSESNQGELSF